MVVLKVAVRRDQARRFNQQSSVYASRFLFFFRPVRCPARRQLGWRASRHTKGHYRSQGLMRKLSYFTRTISHSAFSFFPLPVHHIRFFVLFFRTCPVSSAWVISLRLITESPYLFIPLSGVSQTKSGHQADRDRLTHRLSRINTHTRNHNINSCFVSQWV